MTFHNIDDTIKDYEYRNGKFVYPALSQSNPTLQYLVQDKKDFESHKEPKYVVNDDSNVIKTNYQNYLERAYESSVVKKGKRLNGWHDVEFDGYKLPAQGSYNQYCQKWVSWGCSNTKFHPENKHYAQHEVKTCKRSHCPKCFESWINRQANRSARRFMKFAGKRKFYFRHVILSPPQDVAKKMRYAELKLWLDEALKLANIKTCAVFFHPFRFKDYHKRLPEVSPHFHLISYGYITDTEKFTTSMLELDGINNRKVYGHKWYIENKGDLVKDIDIFNCTRYLLSHTGVRKGSHAVRYLGDISYRKLKLPKEENMHKCPYCLLPLTIFRIVNSPKSEPPPLDQVGLWDSSCFHLVPTEQNDKIPFYTLDKDSDTEYHEEMIHSFEEQLTAKTSNLLIAENKKVRVSTFETSLSCHTIHSFFPTGLLVGIDYHLPSAKPYIKSDTTTIPSQKITNF